MSFKHTSLFLALNALLCIPIAADAAFLERAQDLGHFYYGQRGLGLNQNSTVDTNFGHLGLVYDDFSALLMTGGGSVRVDNGDGWSWVEGTQRLSIFPSDDTEVTYLIDSFVELRAAGTANVNGVKVTVQNNDFNYPAYADVTLQQSFRILPGPGEVVGQLVKVSIAADTVLDRDSNDPRWVTNAFLDGLYPDPFRITYNGVTLASLPGAIDSSQSIFAGSFIGKIGDVIGFEGPAVFAHLTIPGETFNLEHWHTGASAGFYGSVGVTPIPEPETWALLLAGLGWVGWAARRRSRV